MIWSKSWSSVSLSLLSYFKWLKIRLASFRTQVSRQASRRYTLGCSAQTHIYKSRVVRWSKLLLKRKGQSGSRINESWLHVPIPDRLFSLLMVVSSSTLRLTTYQGIYLKYKRKSWTQKSNVWILVRSLRGEPEASILLLVSETALSRSWALTQKVVFNVSACKYFLQFQIPSVSWGAEKQILYSYTSA